MNVLNVDVVENDEESDGGNEYVIHPPLEVSPAY